MIGRAIGWWMVSECSDDSWAGGGPSRLCTIIRGAARLHWSKLHETEVVLEYGSRTLGDLRARLQVSTL